jgi:branched-chain amino acid transport system substrate-binding protein
MRLRTAVVMAPTALALAGAVAACGSDESGGGGGSKVITIGVSTSKTGAYAAASEQELQGVQYGVSEINRQGGVLGKKLKLIVYDDKSDPGTAVKLYTRLITKDRVDALLGPYSSAIGQAVAPLAEKFEMPILQKGATEDPIFASTKYNIQTTVPVSVFWAPLPKLAASQGLKRWVLLNPSSAANSCDSVQKQVEGLGMQVLQRKVYPVTNTDFSSLVLSTKKANPDVVMSCSYGPDSVALTKELNQQGVRPKLLAEAGGPVLPEFAKSVGSLADGVLASTLWWPSLTTPGNDEFVQGFQTKVGEAPNYYAAESYATVQVLVAAIKKAGGLGDNDKLNSILHSMTLPTIMGTYKVNPTGLQIGWGAYLLQWINGKQQLVYPPADAQVSPIASR